jgi:Arc/MetJ-type ribon-helix-helix transcriptional regulator
MKKIQLEVPDKLAEELDAIVKAGWFNDQSEVVLAALREFVQRRSFALQERFQLEDIDWALKQHNAGK